MLPSVWFDVAVSSCRSPRDFSSVAEAELWAEYWATRLIDAWQDEERVVTDVERYWACRVDYRLARVAPVMETV